MKSQIQDLMNSLREFGIKANVKNDVVELTGGEDLVREIYQQEINENAELKNALITAYAQTGHAQHLAITLDDFLAVLEKCNVGFEINSEGLLSFYHADNNTITTFFQSILILVPELKQELKELARSEYFDKPKPEIDFDFPTMKHCTLADRKLRMIYRQLCMKQYGIHGRLLFSKNKVHEALIKAGLVELFDEGLVSEGYVLSLDNEAFEKAVNDFEEKR